MIETGPVFENDCDVETPRPRPPAVNALTEAVIPFTFAGTAPLPDTVLVWLADSLQWAVPDPTFSATPFTVQFHVAVAADTKPVSC